MKIYKAEEKMPDTKKMLLAVRCRRQFYLTNVGGGKRKREEGQVGLGKGSGVTREMEGLSVTLPGLPSASGKTEEASEDGREQSAPPAGNLSTKGGDGVVHFVKINGPRKLV